MITSENETGNIVSYEDDKNEKCGVDIIGKDVIRLYADEVLIKTPLLTEAQDIAGAINELFQGGSDSDDTVDSDYRKWLSLPEPSDNQAVFLVRAAEENMTCTIYVGVPDIFTQTTEGFSIDWGDGTTETFANFYGYSRHTYDAAEEYIVTFTNICGDNTWAVVPNNSSVYMVMAKYGDNVYADRVIGGSSGFVLASQTRLRYIRLPPDTHFKENFFASCTCLRLIEYEGTISELYSGMFNSCNALQFDNLIFKDVTAIPDSCFAHCYSIKRVPVPQCLSIGANSFHSCYSLTKADLPNCETIGNGAFYGCYSLHNISAPKCLSLRDEVFRANYSLRKANFPLCTSMGDYVFEGCRILSDLFLGDGCTYGADCYKNCYALYPKPDGTV